MYQDREGGSVSDALRELWIGRGRPKEGEVTAKALNKDNCPVNLGMSRNRIYI